MGAKNTLLRRKWQEQGDITFRATYGTLHIDVIKRNFYLNLAEIGVDGCNGCLKPKNGMVSVS